MKAQVHALLTQALESFLAEAGSTLTQAPKIVIDTARDKNHGDFASNLALQLAKPLGQAPRAIAEQLIKHLPDNAHISKVEIAGPGFINFFVSHTSQTSVIETILSAKDSYGHLNIDNPETINIEFVSVNPTGPLHVGHGRGAAFGATLANLLAAAGHKVHREYYINDAGRQMDILATSVWLRYLALAQDESLAPVFPRNGYQGDYIWDIAASLHREHGDDLLVSSRTLASAHPDEGEPDGDKEKHIDDLIAIAKSQLGAQYRTVFQLALDTIIENIKTDLNAFGVEFDTWFSEQHLVDDGSVDQTIRYLEDKNTIYTEGNTKWFRTTDYGDEKDRVVVRDNGLKTYFASDLAYHKHKSDRGFSQLINIWGADHHGYIPRVKAGMQALGQDDSLTVLLVQIANLFRAGKLVPMSTRSGEFVTLRELIDEVGSDAARFFYVLRKSEQHMDFDLDLAKAQNNENPVYYIQYAHARVHNVFRQLTVQGLSFDQDDGLAHLAQLEDEAELALIRKLSQYPEVIRNAAASYAPHQLAHYLRELAQAFHSLYNTSKFLVEAAHLRNARLCLSLACAQVIANGLAILGVRAPEHM